MSAAFYKSSGKVGVGGLAGGVIAAAVIGPMIATLYAVAIAYIPFIYLNMILTALFGALTGGGIAYAMKVGKVRNTWVTMIGVFLGTCFVHYVGWMVWMAVMCFRSDFPVPWIEIAFPVTFLMMVVELSEVGAWTIGSSGTPVTGFFLWAVWTIEALIVFGTSLGAAFVIADRDPFCEGCESWCTAEEDALRLSGHVESGALTERLLAGDLGVLAEATRAQPSEMPWHQIDLCVCSGCGGTNTLTLSHVTVTHDKKGNPQTHKNVLVGRMLVNAPQRDWVRSIKHSPGPAAPA